MQNVFIWIKLFCIICIFKTGASNSSDELYIENISSGSSSSSSSSSIKNRDISYSQHNIKDEVDTISGQQAKRDFLMENKHLINQNDIINNHVNDLTSKDILYKNNDNYLALADDNNNKKSGRVAENEGEDILRFSKIREQQQSNREPPKKSKKRKRKRLRKQKDEETIIKDEDILLRDNKSNYNNSSSTNENTQNDARSVNSILNSNQSPDNSNDSGGTVMEMVGAVVDNNYDVNSQLLNQYEQQQHLLQHDKAPLRDGKNNLVMAEREQVPPMEHQMLPSSNEKLSEKKQAKKKLRKGLSKLSSLGSSKQLKRRKKVMVGDLSCMKTKFIPAPMISNANIKYIRNEMYGIEKSFLEAEYQCHSGYKLIKKTKKIQSSKGKNLICKKGRWIGRRPVCKEMKMKLKNRPQQCHSSEAKKCEQLCVIKDNQTEASCECHKGFRLIDNRCFDINECQENEDICEHGCSNTIGGYRCKCPRGFQIDDNNKCVDINECLLRNGHGPCQDICTNIMGSYKCSCDSLEGTWLSKDEHSCEDIDECTVENGGCSHTCLDTMGQAFCQCPEGWILDVDFKTCIDIDECKLQDTMKQENRCLYDCVNTMGSYKCLDNQADQPLEYELNINNIHNKRDHDYNDYTSRDEDLMDEIKTDDTDGNFDIIEGASVVSECFNGYYFNETIGDCQDINECEIDNGGCSHKCTNTNGTFYCSCHNGFALAEDDRYKCIALKILTTEQPKDAETVNIACPALFPPLHGYLECSRPIENSTMTPTGRLRITNRPGSQCILRCPTSYRAVGKFSKTCGENGNWYGDESGVCMRYPTPKLICHQNMFIEIPPHQDAVELKIPKPKTDVNWIRDITVNPSWAKSEKLSLHKGILNITFTAKHPISKLKVSCFTTITTLAGEPPSVDFCPNSQNHKIEKHHENIKIEWIEPKFSDNVNVTEVTKTNIPGTYFGLGSHQIIYEAKDAAGFKNRCIFKIVVNAPKRKHGLQLPINNNKFNY